eukprot:m.53116 g.53116  ORF g.53116 m.53116 type:complete len:402 (+) comp12762_c0_seq3:164-1369(+)
MSNYTWMQPQDLMENNKGDESGEEVNYAAMDDAHVPLSVDQQRSSVASTFSVSSSFDRFMSNHLSPIPEQKPSRPSVMMAISPVELAATPHRYKGWLHKRGNVNKRWKLRWCILKDGNLYYFKNSQDEMARGQFSLSGYRIKSLPKETRPFAFKLEPVSGKGRVWIFAAADENEFNTWVKDLKIEILAYNDAVPDGHASSSVSEDEEINATNFMNDYERDYPSSSESEYDYDAPYDDTICAEEADEVKRHSAFQAKLPPRPREPRLQSMSIPDASLPNPPRGIPPVPPRASKSLTRLVSLDTNIYTSCWFLPGASRDEAEAKLTERGSFLIRRKDANSEPVVTVKADDRCLHYKIYTVDGVGFTLGTEDQEYFASIIELIRHYQKHALPATSLCLSVPFGS